MKLLSLQFRTAKLNLSTSAVSSKMDGIYRTHGETTIERDIFGNRHVTFPKVMCGIFMELIH